MTTDSTFTNAGGDSVAAIRLANEAQSEGWNLDAATVFRYPVLKDMDQTLAPLEQSVTNKSFHLSRRARRQLSRTRIRNETHAIIIIRSRITRCHGSNMFWQGVAFDPRSANVRTVQELTRRLGDWEVSSERWTEAWAARTNCDASGAVFGAPRVRGLQKEQQGAQVHVRQQQ